MGVVDVDEEVVGAPGPEVAQADVWKAIVVLEGDSSLPTNL